MSKHRRFGAAVGIGLGRRLLGLGWGSFVLAKPAGPAIPTIDDIVGSWSGTVSGVEYDLTDGSQTKINVKIGLTVTKIDPVTIHITGTGAGQDIGGTAFYVDGTLADGAAEDNVVPNWARSAYIQFNGQGNHVNGKGQMLSYDTEGNFLDVGTVKVVKVGGPI